MAPTSSLSPSPTRRATSRPRRPRPTSSPASSPRPRRPPHSRRPTFPTGLLVFVVLFLMVQDRIDRRDPKLALAPVYAEPDMGFGELPTRVARPMEGGWGQ